MYSEENEEKNPLLIFLHGGGERGSQLDSVKKHGPPIIPDRGEKIPFVVVSPQCPGSSPVNIHVVTMEAGKEEKWRTGKSPDAESNNF